MRQKKFFKAMSLLLISALLTATLGCGKEVVEEDPKTAYLKTLESGNFYIRHSNYTVEKPYFGEATFSKGSTFEKQNNDAVMWFHGDEDKIPVLYEGDSLIYYSTDPIKEEYTLERYELLPYTIGLCKMTVSPSGRFKIKTDENEKCTYPGADTDQILNFVNDEVIIDTLGGVKLRASKDEITFDDEGNVVNVSTSALTRGGTIFGLERGETYSCEIYEGTIGTLFNFTADVLPIVHWETYTSVDYNFESRTIMNIPIPDDFKSGYYMVNGIGLFRYVKLSEELSDYDLQELGVSTAEEYINTCALSYTLPTIDVNKVDYNVPNPQPETETLIELEQPEEIKAATYGIDYQALLEQIAKLEQPEEEPQTEILYDEEGNRIESAEYYIPKIADVTVEDNAVYTFTIKLSGYDYMNVEKLMVNVNFPEKDVNVYVLKAKAVDNSIIFKMPVPEGFAGICRVTVYNAKYNFSLGIELAEKTNNASEQSSQSGSEIIPKNDEKTNVNEYVPIDRDSTDVEPNVQEGESNEQ